jgi:hypothetical protein
VILLADKYPTGKDFRKLFEVAQGHKMYTRPWKTSLMYTPPSNHTRTLFTVWAEPKAGDNLRMYVETSAFAEFFPISGESALSILGEAGYRSVNSAEVEAFISALDRLFESIEQ